MIFYICFLLKFSLAFSFLVVLLMENGRIKVAFLTTDKSNEFNCSLIVVFSGASSAHCISKFTCNTRVR